MSTTSDWADSARSAREKYSTNKQDKQEDLCAIDVIKSFLNGEQSAPIAARSIADIYEPRIKTKDRENVRTLWGIISEATRPLDGLTTERLVALFIAIGGLPDLVDSAGHPVKYGGAVYWRRLPEWGWMFREYGIGRPRWYSLGGNLSRSHVFC